MSSSYILRTLILSKIRVLCYPLRCGLGWRGQSTDRSCQTAVHSSSTWVRWVGSPRQQTWSYSRTPRSRLVSLWWPAEASPRWEQLEKRAQLHYKEKQEEQLCLDDLQLTAKPGKILIISLIYTPVTQSILCMIFFLCVQPRYNACKEGVEDDQASTYPCFIPAEIPNGPQNP